MKALSALLSLVAVLSAAAALPAHESPEMERQFINGLRAHGYAQYALEYLERLQKQKKLPPELALSLPLEMARTRMALAQELPLEKRPGVFATARAELEKFVRDNADRPQVVPAKVEIARIAALQGKAQLSKAIRQETIETRQAEAIKARALFEAAGKELKDALALIDGQAAKYKDSEKQEDKDALAALTADRLRVEFDQAVNVVLQTQTYFLCVADKDDARRGELAEEAVKLLGEVAARDEKNPLCLKAHAWAVPAFLAMDEPKKAVEQCLKLTNLRIAPDTRDAVFLGAYFQMSLIGKDPRVKKPLEEMRKEAEAWLKHKALGAFGGTPEGYGIWIHIYKPRDAFVYVPSSAAEVRQAVQLELAKAFIVEAEAAKKNPNLYRAKYQQAQKLLAGLEGTDNDLSREARDYSLDVFIALRGEKSDISKLNTFKDLYFEARKEIRQYFKGKKEDQPKHLQNITLALHKALDVADAKVPQHERLKAGSDLVDIYLSTGDPYRAAVFGEHLLRTQPATKETALVAAYTLQALGELLRRDEKLLETQKDKDEGVLSNEVLRRNLEADRERFRQLAAFIEQEPLWKDEQVAQFARYERAMMAVRENDFQQAVRLLEGLSPSWSYYPVAQGRLVLCAAKLAEEKSTSRAAGKLLGFDVAWLEPLTDKERAAYQKRTLAAIAKLPAPSAATSPTAFHLYFVGKLKLCKLLNREQKYPELEKLATELLLRFDQNKAVADKLDEEVKNDLRLGLETWLNYAKLGQAEQLYAKGQYAQVLAVTTPTVARVQGLVKAAAAGSIKPNEVPVIRDMLELALRAHVQMNQRAKAHEILDLLQKVAADEKLTGGPSGIKPTEILVRLVLQLKAQIDDLRRQGPAAKDKLAQTVGNFTLFMDEMTKDLDGLVKNLEKLEGAGGKTLMQQRVLGILARSYASLDNYKKAAALLARIKPPAAKDPKKPTPAELAAVKDYNDAQLLLAQALRKDKQLDQATKVLEAIKYESKLPLDLVIQSLEVEKEKILLLEEKGDNAEAISKLTKFMKDRRLLGLMRDRDFEGLLSKFPAERGRLQKLYRKMYQDVARLYFDCHYHKTYCLYKYAVSQPDQKKRTRYLAIAAGRIQNLEGASDGLGWKLVGQQYLDLLRSEPLLDAEYKKLKKPA